MIGSLKGRLAKQIAAGEKPRNFPTTLLEPAQLRLAALRFATRLGDLRVPPGNRLEALQGDRKGQHSIRINSQWRICFRWIDGRAEDVEITDYH